MSRSSNGLFFRSMLVIIATTAVLSAVFCAARVQAQAVAQSHLDGDWKNIDPHTRGIDVIVIAGDKIHPFAACYPNDCDWGVLKVRKVASGGNSTYIGKLVVKHTESHPAHDALTGMDYDESQVVTSQIVDITISLLSDGRLRVDTITRFTDGSGRAARRAVNFLERSVSPFAP